MRQPSEDAQAGSTTPPRTGRPAPANRARISKRLLSIDAARLAPFRREAQGILELPADVATADMLKQRIRDQVLAEALPL
jgi:hypothetical protein